MRFLLLVLFACASSGLWAGEPAIGSIPPELGGTTFFNAPDSSPVTLASLRGKVVLIDFWATWCHPCVEAIPHIRELYEKYHKQGLVVIGHTDSSSENLAQFIKDKPIPYIISVSSGQGIGTNYGVTGIPHVYIIDPDGKVAWHGHPASLDEKTITDLLPRVRLTSPSTPTFDTPATVAKVAHIEDNISKGKVGAGVKALEKIVAGTEADGAAAAKTSLDTVHAWQKSRDGEIEKLQSAGDVFAAAQIAVAMATAYAGSDDAKGYSDQAATLKKDPNYGVGKEYHKIADLPSAARSDPQFAQLVTTFLKHHPDGYYADQARELQH